MVVLGEWYPCTILFADLVEDCKKLGLGILWLEHVDVSCMWLAKCLCTFSQVVVTRVTYHHLRVPGEAYIGDIVGLEFGTYW